MDPKICTTVSSQAVLGLSYFLGGPLHSPAMCVTLKESLSIRVYNWISPRGRNVISLRRTLPNQTDI